MDDIFSPNQRIIILQMMHADNDYSLSNEMLQRVLVQFGHGVDLAKTDKELDWLESRSLLKIEALTNTLRVAKLTRAGIDVAKGLTRVEGIDRPLPE